MPLHHNLHHLTWALFVRIVQAVFAIIVLGLTGHVLNVELGWYWFFSNDTVSFELFNSVWTLIVALPYLSIVPIFLAHLSHIYVVLALEAVTTIFWFAGFIALASLLPSPQYCGGDICSSLQAAVVFSSFEWFLFAITLGFTIHLALQPRDTAPPRIEV